MPAAVALFASWALASAPAATTATNADGAQHENRRGSHQPDHGRTARDGGRDDVGQVTRLVKPLTAMPFWFMAPSFMGKILFTALVFGFDIRFKMPKGEADKRRVLLKKTGALSMRILFILMALNSWHHDIRRLMNMQPSTFYEGLLIGMVIWAGSPNLAAAASVCTSVTMFNPMRLFRGLRPKYAHIHGYPLLPCTASWLPFPKHVYVMVLMPYFLPYAVLNLIPLTTRPMTLGLYNLVVGCTSAVACWSFGKIVVLFCWWAAAVAATFYLWPRGRDMFWLYWEEGAWIFWMYVMIHTWMVVAIFIAGAIYARIIGVSVRELVESTSSNISLPMSPNITYPLAPTTTRSSMSFRDRTRARYDHFEPFSQFQDLSSFEEEHHREVSVVTEQQRGLAKYVLFYGQLLTMCLMLLNLQIAFLTWSRVLIDGMPFLEAAGLTVGERHISTYLRSVFLQTTHALQNFADWAHCIWLLL